MSSAFDCNLVSTGWQLRDCYTPSNCTFNQNVERLRAHPGAVVLHNARHIHIRLYFTHIHFGYLLAILECQDRVMIVDGVLIH